MTYKKSEKQAISEKLAPELKVLGEAKPLSGSEINLFTQTHKLHLIEASMALGVNTAALYTKKSAGNINSTLSLLLRIFSAFPEHLPRLKAPDVHELIARIKAVDPTFKLTHLGPLLGLERNSSTRIKNTGIRSSNPMVQSLAQVISLAMDDDPENWFIIKQFVEIEAKARGINPPERVWREGGWGGKTKQPDATPDDKAEATAAEPKASNTFKQVKRRAK